MPAPAAGRVHARVDADGIVTLDQQRAVVHPDAANPDDPVTLAADDLVTLTATVTDRDGDSASATADIGPNLTFEDDGPVAVDDVDAILPARSVRRPAMSSPMPRTMAAATQWAPTAPW